VKVRKRAIFTIAIVFSVALIIIILASQTEILAGFGRLEKSDTATQVGRASDALTRQITDLDTLTYNNAAWDDTYQFINDNNTTYIESNWNEQVLSSEGINLLVFMNNSGQVIYAIAFNTSTVNDESVYMNVMESVPQYNALWHFGNTDDHTDGLLNVAGSLFLIASRPVIHSDFSGPANGALIIGVEIKDTFVVSLSEETRMDIDINNLATSTLSANLTKASANLPSVGSVYINAESNNRVVGYELLGDVNGNPCAILSVSLPRDIYAQGIATVNVLIVMFVLFFVGFTATSILFLELSW
jgi:sensor domain CHASE-containing protein